MAVSARCRLLKRDRKDDNTTTTGRAIGDHVLDVTPSVQGQLMPRQQPATTARPLHSFQRGVAREGVPVNECGMTKRNPAIGEGLRGGLAANLAVAQKEEGEGCALQRAWPARIRFEPGIYTLRLPPNVSAPQPPSVAAVSAHDRRQSKCRRYEQRARGALSARQQ